MISAVIVAGGKGLRMRHSTRKQYLLLGARPVLSHTLATFLSCPEVTALYLVVPEEDFAYCEAEVITPPKTRSIHLVPAGAERQDSVYNGLRAAGGSRLVVIHDGVRPFIRPDQISACLREAEREGACIMGIPALDTLKQVDDHGYIRSTPARDAIWHAQTPQAFHYSLILQAHEQARHDGFLGTDDASLLERTGRRVKIIPGSKCNLKITTPEDLELARLLLGLWQPDSGNKSEKPG